MTKPLSLKELRAREDKAHNEYRRIARLRGKRSDEYYQRLFGDAFPTKTWVEEYIYQVLPMNAERVIYPEQDTPEQIKGHDCAAYDLNVFRVSGMDGLDDIILVGDLHTGVWDMWCGNKVIDSCKTSFDNALVRAEEFLCKDERITYFQCEYLTNKIYDAFEAQKALMED